MVRLVSVEPSVIAIPPDRLPLHRWPDYESMEGLGTRSFRLVIEFDAKIAAGGGFQLAFGYQTDNVDNPALTKNAGYLLGPSRALRSFPLPAPQTEDPSARNFVSARRVASERDDLEVKCVSRGSAQRQVLQVTAAKGWKKGEQVLVQWGDRSQGSPGASVPWHPGRPEVVLFADAEGQGTYSFEAPTGREILFTGERVESVSVHLPLTTRSASSFPFSVILQQSKDDSPLANVLTVENAEGLLSFASSDPAAVLPDPVVVTADDRGTFRGFASFATPGRQTLEARFEPTRGASEENAPIVGISNSTMVDWKHHYRVMAGDLQRHCAEGGHAAIPAVLCWQQLFDRGDDFGGVVPHIAGRYAGFRHANRVARRFQQQADPDEESFVAFAAYEWSKAGQHRHVVFETFTEHPGWTDRPSKGEESPPPEPALQLEVLLETIRDSERRVLAIPHHSLMAREDWPHEKFPWGPQLEDPAQPLVEIFNRHGSSERHLKNVAATDYFMKQESLSQRPREQGASVQDAIAAGYRFGFVAGSDNHAYGLSQSRVIGSITGYSRGGLGFAFVEPGQAPLRQRLFDAFLAKRTYATTGSRTFLWFGTTDGSPMGQEVTGNVAPELEIFAIAAGEGRRKPSTIRRVTLFRDGGHAVLDREVDSEVVSLTWQDPSPDHRQNVHSYYVRVIQDDHHRAWSSPLWWSRN